MLVRLLLLFTIIPIVELALLIQIGQYIGTLNTIALILVTGVVGAFLAKSQGLAIISRIKHQLDAGNMPGVEIIDGVCILAGGVTLLTPGLLTDAAGFLLIVPFTRVFFRKLILKKIRQKLADGSLSISGFNQPPS